MAQSDPSRLPPKDLMPCDRHQSPHRLDWEEHRRTITSLYINEDVKLTDIRQIMADTYGFRATPRMYKTRFDQWGLQKYLNAKRKEAALKTSELTQPYIMSKSLKSKLSKIPMGTANSEVAPRIEVCRTTYFNSDDRHVAAVLAHLPHYYRASMLNNSENCYDTQTYKSDNLITACKAPNFNSYLFRVSEKPRSLWDLCNSSLVLLQKKEYLAARSLLDQASDRMRDVLRSKPQDFFRKLFMVFGARKWSHFDDWRQHLLRFFAAMAFKTLGPAHPLSVILAHLQRTKCLDLSAEPSMQYLVNNVPNASNNSHREVPLIYDSFAVVLIRQRSYERAESVLKDAIAVNESHQRFCHDSTRIYFRRLANLYMHIERWKDAERICETILLRDQLAAEQRVHGYDARRDGLDTALSRPVLEEPSVRTMQDLAFLTEQRGYLDGSEDWKRRAAHALLHLFTLDQMQDMLWRIDRRMLLDRTDPVACARRVLDSCSTMWCCGEKNT